MKKEYVKPNNRVVELKDKLMQGPGFGETSIPGGVPFDSKQNGFDSDSEDSSSDVWED